MHTLRKLVALACLATASCTGTYDHVEIFVIGGDRRTEVSTDGIRIGEGGVVVIEARAEADPDGNEYNGLEEFELRMSDSRIAKVRKGVLADSWVISGAEPGDTIMQIRVDGRLEQIIPVRVERQP